MLIIVLVVTRRIRLIANENRALKAGKIGEQTIQCFLGRLNPKKYIVLNDFMLRHTNGQITQIDHIVVSRKGIFVIETKNYGGVLYGNCDGRYWTHVKGYTKSQVYSCVRQNEGHIKAIKDLLANLLEYLSDRKYHRLFVSVIVVHDRCKLKISGRRKKLRVINFSRLIKTIKRINRRNLISNTVRDKAVFILENSNINSKVTNKEHLKQIRSIKY